MTHALILVCEYAPPLVMMLAWGLTLIYQLYHHQLKGWALAALALCFSYVQSVIAVTIFPLSPLSQPRPVVISLILSELINWQPRQLLGNLALLAPLAFAVPILHPRMAHLSVILGLCLTTSLSIELAQVGLTALGLGWRSFDLGDLVLNTIGGWFGYAGFVLVRHWFPRVLDQLDLTGDDIS